MARLHCGRCDEVISSNAKMCPKCRKRVHIRWSWSKHLPWAVASVFTCGLVIPIWLMAWGKSQPAWGAQARWK